MRNLKPLLACASGAGADGPQDHFLRGDGARASRFYAGLAVGLIITDNKVRHAAIQLGKDIIGAVL